MNLKRLLIISLATFISTSGATGALALENVETCTGTPSNAYKCTAEWGYVGEDPYNVDRFSTELSDGTKHGCTSFAAFMLALYNDWMPAISTFDSARYWETDAVTKTNSVIVDTPKVGDIAQWDASANLTFGHVAYVKSVVLTYGGAIYYIIVADDNGGRVVTTQRKLYPGVTAGTIRWPDHFIRIPKAVSMPAGGGFGNVAMLTALLPTY